MLGTGQTLLQKTHTRLTSFIPSKNIQVLTNERYLDLVLDQLPGMSKEQVVLEPAMRNTAPCILLAAMKIYKKNPEAVMLVAPSDHWIEDEQAFQENVLECFRACQQDSVLATLGIEPTFPNTGYGYIESDKEDTSSMKRVLQFREKPDYETAKQFIEEGNFYWNAGIFMWSVQSILNAFEQLMPEMFSLFAKGMEQYNTEEESTFIQAHYEKAEDISIDYGILEKAANVLVKPANFDWNDLGTWGALHDKLDKDDQRNAVVRAATHTMDASGNMIFSASDKLVVIDGIDDYIIVDKEDVLLLFPKGKEQNIKELLGEIKDKYGEKYS